MTTTRWFICLSLITAPACDGLGDGKTHGTPLMTVRGTMTPTEAPIEVGEIRMALAWYPGLLINATEESTPSGEGGDEVCHPGFPTGIVTQEIAYEPIFPIEFRFDVTSPPPPEAVVQIEDPAYDGKGAIGVLVAYEDRNGNDTLDPCPLDGPCVDRVLGSSGGDLFGAVGRGSIVILYADRAWTDPEEPSFRLEAGLNLIDMSMEGGLLPRDTSIRIQLGDDPRVQQVSCEQICSTYQGGAGAIGCGGSEGGAECPVEAPVIPEGAEVDCFDEGRAVYVVATTCASPCSCVVNATLTSLTPEQTPPADWPCPLL